MTVEKEQMLKDKIANVVYRTTVIALNAMTGSPFDSSYETPEYLELKRFIEEEL